jgi:ABC-type nitrate/sulfonate/bicarbonate transport system ATPase subunit
LPAGRTTCLLGPSGVGKSSLLRLIAGLAEGARGHVGDAAGAAVQGRIAYMAQDDLLLPWATVLGNVMLGPRLRGEPADTQTRDRAMELLARVGLAESAGHRPDRLSGGMRQRVALARTLTRSCWSPMTRSRPCVSATGSWSWPGARPGSIRPSSRPGSRRAIHPIRTCWRTRRSS